jgi:hypothetical protein
MYISPVTRNRRDLTGSRKPSRKTSLVIATFRAQIAVFMINIEPGVVPSASRKPVIQFEPDARMSSTNTNVCRADDERSIHDA